MPNTAQGETQQVRLTKLSVAAARVAKSEAALQGITLDEYLTSLIENTLLEEEETCGVNVKP